MQGLRRGHYELATETPRTLRIAAAFTELAQAIRRTVRHGITLSIDQATQQCHNTHRPHRALSQAVALRPLPNNVIDLDTFLARRLGRAAGLLHEYHQVA